MSREIKFRIWDDFKKEWLGSSDKDSLTFYGFHLVGEVMTVQCPPQWALDSCCIVEQYTGLKDKNGKEIYEGDIVQIYKGGTTYEVAWMEKDGGWFCFSNSDDHYEPLYHADFEAIGNIHENPELLKEASCQS